MCTKIVVFFMRVVDHCVLRDRRSWVLKYHWWIVWGKKFVFRILCQTQALVKFALFIFYALVCELFNYFTYWFLSTDFYLLFLPIWFCMCFCIWLNLYVVFIYIITKKKKKKKSYIIANKDDIIVLWRLLLIIRIYKTSISFFM